MRARARDDVRGERRRGEIVPVPYGRQPVAAEIQGEDAGALCRWGPSDAHLARTASHVPEKDSRPWTRTTSGGFAPLPAWKVARTFGAAMAIAPRSMARARLLVVR